MPDGKLHIAILGTRGIPARYGGFETFAEELSARLVARGHRVTVYGRRKFFQSGPLEKEYRGVDLRFTPTVMQKYLETILHAVTSFLDLARCRPDVVLLCNAANAPFAWIGRGLGVPVAINVDGIERKRAKWNAFGRLWYRLGELCSVLFASRVVSDAQVIADYYRERYRADSTVIAYGGTANLREPGPTLSKFGLSRRGYILYVARLEPENNALGVVQAFVRSNVNVPLVVVGDAPYAQDYIASVHAAANERVIFTGYQFGEAYQELQSNCLIYVQATEVGGTHPALVEAMAYGNCIVANGTPENVEVLAEGGQFYDVNNFDQLAAKFGELVGNPAEQDRMRTAAKTRADKVYQWDRITEQYETLLSGLAGKSRI